MDVNYEDLMMQKEVKGSMDAGQQVDNDSDKYEVDLINATLDKIKHEWMGEKLDNGVWKRDPSMPKMMNKGGASYLITELNLFNPTSNFGVLLVDQKHNEKDEIVSDAWESVNEVLLKKDEEFEINNAYKNAVMKQFKNQLRILLSIIINGGMRNYRADKLKTIINKQEVSSNQAY